MIDPVLEGFDMPLNFDPPISPPNIVRVDGTLVTHIDNDHFSRQTLQAIANVTKQYHATQYVAEEMKSNGLPAQGHNIWETFDIDMVQCQLTPTWHNWQNTIECYAYRKWNREDYCGFYLNTPDGSIWIPGDSRLIEEQLHLKEPDVILLDFSDDAWHITFEGAVKLSNAYLNSALIPIHWGSVDAPDSLPFNGDPRKLKSRIINPQRIHILLPGEAYIME